VNRLRINFLGTVLYDLPTKRREKKKTTFGGGGWGKTLKKKRKEVVNVMREPRDTRPESSRHCRIFLPEKGAIFP